MDKLQKKAREEEEKLNKQQKTVETKNQKEQIKQQKKEEQLKKKEQTKKAKKEEKISLSKIGSLIKTNQNILNELMDNTETKEEVITRIKKDLYYNLDLIKIYSEQEKK